MRFDTKIAVAVREGLAAWQELNVTAFLASAVAGGAPETIGKPYEDAAGTAYLPMFRQPVLVYTATAEQLAAVREKAVARELAVAVYTAGMFTTDNDDDNRAVVRDAPVDGLDLVGLAVYGPRNRVDKTLKGLALHG